MNDQNVKDALMSVRLDEEKKEAMKGALLAAAPVRQRMPVRRVLTAAAAFLLIIGLGFAGYKALTKDVTPTLPPENTGAVGGQVEGTEPDKPEETTAGTAETEAPGTEAPTEPSLVNEVNQPVSVVTEQNPVFSGETGTDIPTNVGNLWNITDPNELESIHWRELVRGEPGTGSGSYLAPKAGTHAYSTGLTRALEQYAGRDDVNYYVRIDVIRYTDPDGTGTDCNTLPPDESLRLYEEIRERMYETAALEEVSFVIEQTALWYVPQSTTFGAMVYDASFFEHFPDLPDCGFFVSLYDELS
ncbi:MAG: hypothetical protein IK104_01010 [Clostridia bacterium]|nr:hypothetical protein [Clostridia bacterium]